MKREIKFRVWTYGKMNYLDNRKNGLLYRCGEVVLSSGWDSHDDPTFYGDPEFELMQSIGLKDKFGKEIYEGDILKADDESATVVIEFRGGQFVGYNAKLSIPETQNRNWFSWVIIGNIYQNPELIK